jgi:hypothetical protein
LLACTLLLIPASDLFQDPELRQLLGWERAMYMTCHLELWKKPNSFQRASERPCLAAFHPLLPPLLLQRIESTAEEELGGWAVVDPVSSYPVSLQNTSTGGLAVRD